MKIFRIARIALCTTALLGLAACGNNTEVEQTWKSPALQNLRFHRILVVATTPDGAARRIVEDSVRDNLKSVTVVPGYTVITDTDALKDKARLKAALQETQADGLIVIRPISDNTEVNVTPGVAYPMPYRTLEGYWGPNYGLRALYADPVVYTDRVVQVETSIYDAKTTELVWSGTTATRNPGNLKHLVKDIADTLRTELQKQQLIP